MHDFTIDRKSLVAATSESRLGSEYEFYKQFQCEVINESSYNEKLQFLKDFIQKHVDKVNKKVKEEEF